MFRPTVDNPNQKRTIRPLYAQTQATPYAGFIDPAWMESKEKDILPGMVMCRAKGETFTLYTGAEGQVPFGLSALFVAPKLGIDEVTPTNSNLFTVWVGGPDSLFEVLAPAFDPAGQWSVEDGKTVLLTGNANGQLTTTGATAQNAIAELIDVIGSAKIVVRLLTPAAA